MNGKMDGRWKLNQPKMFRKLKLLLQCKTFGIQSQDFGKKTGVCQKAKRRKDGDFSGFEQPNIG